MAIDANQTCRRSSLSRCTIGSFASVIGWDEKVYRAWQFFLHKTSEWRRDVCRFEFHCFLLRFWVPLLTWIFNLLRSICRQGDNNINITMFSKLVICNSALQLKEEILKCREKLQLEHAEKLEKIFTSLSTLFLYLRIK